MEQEVWGQEEEVGQPFPLHQPDLFLPLYTPLLHCPILQLLLPLTLISWILLVPPVLPSLSPTILSVISI